MFANRKKLVVFMLVFAMIVSCFTACGKGSKKPEETASPEVTEETEEETADPNAEVSQEPEEEELFSDLGGMEVVVGDWYTEEETLSTQYAEDTKAYRDEIQETYNFKITREQVSSWSDMLELFTTSTINKDPIADVVYLYQTQMSSPLQNGLFYDLSTLKSFDFTEEKWNHKITELMTVGSGIYGMNIEQEPRGGVFYNKRLFEEAGIDPEEPYNLQASGEWNWDKFAEYCKKLTIDHNKDGQIDQYALASFSKDYYKLCAASNGALFVGKENGKFYNGTSDPAWLEAIQWGTKFLTDKYIMPKPKEAGWDWFIAAFRDCEVAMQVAEVYQVSTWADMDDDFGFVLFPAGPKGNMVTCPMDNIVVIPSCIEAEKAEKIAFAYDKYTDPTPGYELDESWKMRYYPLFTDERAVDETLTLMRDEKHKVNDYLPLVYDMDYGDFSFPVYALASTPAEQLEKITPTWNALIEDINSRYN